MVASEEASVRRQGRGMHRLQHQMFARVNKALLGDGIVAPKEEYKMLPPLRQRLDSGIGKLFPSVM